MTSSERVDIAALGASVNALVASQNLLLAPLADDVRELTRGMAQRAVDDMHRDDRITRVEDLLADLWAQHKPLSPGQKAGAWATLIGVGSGVVYLVEAWGRAFLTLHK